MTTSDDNCRLIYCRVCGKAFDPGDLGQVIFHETHRQRPDVQYSGSRKVHEGARNKPGKSDA